MVQKKDIGAKITEETKLIDKIMNRQQIFKALVLSSPLVVASLLVNLSQPTAVKAIEIKVSNSMKVIGNSDNSPIQEEFPFLEENEYGDLIIDFSEEESNTAIDLFGCDCLSSINALRKMRGIARGVEGELLTPETQIASCPHRTFIGI